jgi:hypothetical protein
MHCPNLCEAYLVLFVVVVVVGEMVASPVSVKVITPLLEMSGALAFTAFVFPVWTILVPV